MKIKKLSSINFISALSWDRGFFRLKLMVFFSINSNKSSPLFCPVSPFHRANNSLVIHTIQLMLMPVSPSRRNLVYLKYFPMSFSTISTDIHCCCCRYAMENGEDKMTKDQENFPNIVKKRETKENFHETEKKRKASQSFSFAFFFFRQMSWTFQYVEQGEGKKEEKEKNSEQWKHDKKVVRVFMRWKFSDFLSSSFHMRMMPIEKWNF